jgi:Spy/CpxP family protein refolding chaperone
MRKLLLILLPALLIWAQGPGPDPLAEHFVPPELIMQNQKALGITDSQREQIKQRVSNAQVRFTQLQWDLQAQVEALSGLLSDRKVDEASVLEQLNKVLSIEADIKRTHLSMLLALRKVLTTEQFDKALELKRDSQTSPRLEEQWRRLRQYLKQQQELEQRRRRR